MVKQKTSFWSAVAVLVGSCIGAGVLGIPYVAAQAGFFVALAYIFVVGGIVLLVNLYLGEVSLRTRGDHQLVGYAEMYLGKWGKHAMEFAIIFLSYAAMTAYILGIGESLSFIIFGSFKYTSVFGVAFGIFMGCLLWGGMSYLKRYEKLGVTLVLSLVVIIFVSFFGKIDFSNLMFFNLAHVFLPFGVVLFALMSFSAIPEVGMALKGEEKKLRRVILMASLVSILVYSIFTFVVLGFMGSATPEVATIALGGFFVFLGVLTMSTSHLALGNALQDSFKYDERFSHRISWALTAIIPILIFLLVRLFGFLSFTKILALGGVVAGGIMGILTLFLVRSAKKNGKRNPEYSIPINWFIVGFLVLVFVVGVVWELFFG